MTAATHAAVRLDDEAKVTAFAAINSADFASVVRAVNGVGEPFAEGGARILIVDLADVDVIMGHPLIAKGARAESEAS